MAKKNGGQISQPANDKANLPQEVIIKNYPSIDYGMVDDADDTIVGVDEQMNECANKMKRERSKRKY